MKIVSYNDNYKEQIIDLWKNVFGYKDKRNNPEIVINKKIATDDNLFFIALLDNIVIGTIMAGYDGHRGWIYLLAVEPKHRSKNIGTKLLNKAEKCLKDKGCVKINLQILYSNESVKSFYFKNGYKIEERISMGKEISENI